MRTNADLTIYNKYIDPATRAEKYQRTQIRSIVWESRKAVNTIASGGTVSVDSVRVFIPFARDANYLSPKAWQALVTKTGKWTLQEGDYIVKGLVADEITGAFTTTSLRAKYDNVLVISSVDTMDVGSLSLQHWQIGAK